VIPTEVDNVQDLDRVASHQLNLKHQMVVSTRLLYLLEIATVWYSLVLYILDALLQYHNYFLGT
jgi:hypothetical protein